MKTALKLLGLCIVLMTPKVSAQKMDLLNAPKNPVAYEYKIEHFGLKGPVYSYRTNVFSKTGSLVFDNIFGGKSLFYDANGRLTHTSEGNEFKYGSNGYIESYTYASLGIKTAEYFYNDKGLLIAKKFDKTSKANDYEYTYDSQDRIIKSYRNDNNYTIYTYEKKGDDLIIQENDVRDGVATLKTLKYNKGILVSYDDVLMSTYNKMDAYGNWTRDYDPVIFYDDLKTNANVFSMVYTKQSYTIDKLRDCKFFLNGKQTDAIYNRSSKSNEVIIFNPFDEQYYIIENAVDDSRSGQKQVFTKVYLPSTTFLNISDLSSYKLVHKGVEYRNNLYLRSGSLVVNTYQNNYLVYDKFLDKTFTVKYNPDSKSILYELLEVKGTNIIYIRRNNENGFLALDKGKPLESTYTVGYNGNDGILYKAQTPEYYLPQLKTSSVGVVHPGRKYNASTDKGAGTDNSNTSTSTSSTSTCITGNCTDGYGNLQLINETLTGYFVNGKANGFVIAAHTNGDSYMGNYVNGLRDGYGIYSWKNSESKYYGQWKSGLQHGYGYVQKAPEITQAGYYEKGKLVTDMLTQSFKNGSYVGRCKGDCENGFGQFDFDGGSWYFGFFKNGSMHHMGAYKWSNRDIYLGEYRHDKRSGNGIIYKNTGVIFAGNYLNDVRNGWGVQIEKGGKESIIGYWKDDQVKTDITTTKTINSSNTNQASAEDSNTSAVKVSENCLSGNCTDGFGSLKTSLSTITGFFTNGQATGYGKEVYNDGTGYYQGAFKNSLRDGFGMYEWSSSGQYYIGQWKSGNYHGYGYFYKGTEVLQAGYYENGKQITNLLSQNFIDGVNNGNCVGDCTNGFGSYKYSSGDLYIGFFSNGMKGHVGSYNWKEGNFYIGEYVNGKATGHGLEYYTSVESIYHGEFFSGNRQGLGAYFNKSEEIKSKGYWNEGILKTAM